MTSPGPAHFDSARLEAALACLPEPPPGLDEARQQTYRSRRRRIGRRHSQWRCDVPAIDSLFDDESHRARALAGNIATELEQCLCAGAELVAQDRGAGAAGDAGEVHRWVAETTSSWGAVALESLCVRDWPAEPRRVFTALLEELTSRGKERARALLTGAGEVRRASGIAALARRAVAALGHLLARVFRPTAGG